MPWWTRSTASCSLTGDMDIKILVVADCPNAGPAAELVERTLDALDRRDATVTTHVITTQDEAQRLNFTGTPPFLVDGRDPF